MILPPLDIQFLLDNTSSSLEAAYRWSRDVREMFFCTPDVLVSGSGCEPIESDVKIDEQDENSAPRKIKPCRAEVTQRFKVPKAPSMFVHFVFGNSRYFHEFIAISNKTGMIDISLL